MRYALLAEYDGSGFHGSQLQKGVRTVQGELEAAISRIYGSPTRLSMAGRTDTGVHALGQVAAFDADERHDSATLREALNYHLDDDVAVKEVEAVAQDFDPRRHAEKREYVFSINDGPSRSPLRRRHEVRTKKLQNLEEMKSVAALYVGSHDFASFAGPATPDDASTVRQIFAAEVKQDEASRYRVLITGNAFVHQQVRRMTGALVQVGTGKLTVAEVRDLLSNPRRGAAGWPLSPEGLCLSRIEYGKDGPFSGETEYN